MRQQVPDPFVARDKFGMTVIVWWKDVFQRGSMSKDCFVVFHGHYDELMTRIASIGVSWAVTFLVTAETFSRRIRSNA